MQRPGGQHMVSERGRQRASVAEAVTEGEDGRGEVKLRGLIWTDWELSVLPCLILESRQQ